MLMRVNRKKLAEDIVRWFTEVGGVSTQAFATRMEGSWLDIDGSWNIEELVEYLVSRR